jgi:Dolichyl-phosphate-mannose-protein mannosyltransferase
MHKCSESWAGTAQWAIGLGCTVLAAGLYVVLLWQAFPATQTDIGGDYAYAAWQLSHGAVLYRDVLGQQTPALYLLGALAYRLWSQPGVFLAVALGVRAATVITVFSVARACRFPPLWALVASLIYLLLPMGFVFDARFEPNLLITLGGVLCTLALTELSPRRAILAGLGCGLAILAKLTFAPIALALAAYLLVTRRSLLLPFILSALSVVLVVATVGLTSAGQGFIQGAFLAHVGSTLSVHNFVVSAQYLWRVEGFTVLGTLAGALLGVRQAGPRRLLALYLLGGLTTLGATISVGSLAPEMLAGEPAVALCATLALQDAVTAWRQRRAAPLYVRLVPLLGLLIVVGQPLAVRDDALILRTSRPSTGLICLVHLLRHSDHRPTPVIALPYAAFLAQRPRALGLSDIFNWSIRVHRGDRTARLQARAIIHRLMNKQIALVAFDDDHPLPPEVEHAVVTFYAPGTVCSGTHVFLPTTTGDH